MPDNHPHGPSDTYTQGIPRQDSDPPLGNVSSPAEKFLRAMAKILVDRALYPENHPKIMASMNDLHQLLENLFIEKDHRIFVFIEDQIYIDDRLIKGDANQAAIAQIFTDKGIEVLTLLTGLKQEELHLFVEYLAAPKTENVALPRFQSHFITLGKLALEEDGKTKIMPSLQNLNMAIHKNGKAENRYSEETKVLRDLYLDWSGVQTALIKNVGKIMLTLETSLFSNMSSLIPLAELKSYDEYTYVHAINIAILTMAQAEAQGYSKEAIHAFGTGAMLHDVGKTEVAVKVLHKQGKLTEAEFEQMKSHPTRGAMMLLGFPEIPRVAAIVAYEHHLKYNCSGYPTMKQSRPQHIASRFTAIADQFDAMRSNRPYRDAMAPKKILEIMEDGKGAEIDPGLFDEFLVLIKNRKVI